MPFLVHILKRRRTEGLQHNRPRHISGDFRNVTCSKMKECFNHTRCKFQARGCNRQCLKISYSLKRSRRNNAFKVKNMAGTSSKGSKGAREMPCRTMARSHVGTLVRAAGLSLKVPQRKRETRGSFPNDIPPKGMW